MSDSFPDRLIKRAQILRDEGLDWAEANSIAWLEERILQWPPAWGDDLHILIYGDFKPPSADLLFPTLGITVHCINRQNTIIKGATTVLDAIVKVDGKNIPALVEAGRRINLLLGAYTLHEWGNAGCGWWSWVTHDSIAGVVTNLTLDGIERSVEAILRQPAKVRRRLEAALFWVRDPRNLFFESYQPDVLRMYSSYWNAFECLVEAVQIVKPRQGLSKVEKQSKIAEFMKLRTSAPTAEDIQYLYHSVVNPGFVGKASHALSVCFGAEGERYVEECFQLPDRASRLYDIRNAINHGEIDAENPRELMRVEARLRRLWMIVWQMFGRFVPFPAPVDSKHVR
jgi:hypothetical protein